MSKPLPEPDEPLYFNGLAIQAQKREPENNKVLRDLLHAPQLATDDLPVEPKLFAAMTAAFGLASIGLTNAEIGHALGINRDQVAALMQHAKYGEVTELVANGAMNAYRDTVRAFLVQQSINAAHEMAAIVNDESMKASERRQAAKDILDRAGLKAADVVKHEASQGLKIVISDKSENKTITMGE